MGRANRMRISQRMSQHIMQLRLVLNIRASSEETSYQDGMFIAYRISFVNTFFERAAGSPAVRSGERTGSDSIQAR